MPPHRQAGSTGGETELAVVWKMNEVEVDGDKPLVSIKITDCGVQEVAKVYEVNRQDSVD